MGGVWGLLIIRAYLEFLTYPQPVNQRPVDNFGPVDKSARDRGDSARALFAVGSD